jgi:hypothetical protein
MKSGISHTPDMEEWLSKRQRGIIKPSLIHPMCAVFSAELEKVLPSPTGTSRAKQVQDIATDFVKSPILGLRHWCELVPKKGFTEASNIRIWIHILVMLIDRHAEITKRIHKKSTYWRSNCIKGMFRMLNKRTSRDKKSLKSWRKFVDQLVYESLPHPANSPMYDRYFMRKKDDVENFKKLSTFISQKKNPWGTDYEFPLCLVRGLKPLVLKLMLRSGSHEKKIALQAIRMDLKDQISEAQPDSSQQQEALFALSAFIIKLGDRKLAERIAENNGLIFPQHAIFLQSLMDTERMRLSIKRRPNAKRRKRSAD